MYWCFEPGQLEKAKEVYRQELIDLGWEQDLIDDFLNDVDRFLKSRTAHELRLVIEPGEVHLSEPEGGNAETGE